MTDLEMQSLHRHLLAAVAVLEKAMATADEEIVARNPTYFREGGHHLSDAGIKAIYDLFDQGSSIEQVAKTMGISVRGAAGRRQAWLKKKR